MTTLASQTFNKVTLIDLHIPSYRPSAKVRWEAIARLSRPRQLINHAPGRYRSLSETRPAPNWGRGVSEEPSGESVNCETTVSHRVWSAPVGTGGGGCLTLYTCSYGSRTIVVKMMLSLESKL